MTDRVGALADGVPYVHVFDRGANNIKVFCHAARQRCDGVIRASSRPRTVVEETADGSLEHSSLRARPTTAAGNLLRRQA